MKENYTALVETDSGAATRGYAVTKSDSTVLSPIPRALWVGTAGDLVVDMVDGDSALTIPGVPAGTMLAIRVTKVRAATTAAGIVAFQ